MVKLRSGAKTRESDPKLTAADVQKPQDSEVHIEDDTSKRKRTRRGSVEKAEDAESTQIPVRTRRASAEKSTVSARSLPAETPASSIEPVTSKARRSRRGSTEEKKEEEVAMTEQPASPHRQRRASARKLSAHEANGGDTEKLLLPHSSSESELNTAAPEQAKAGRDMTVHRCSFVDFKPEGIETLAASGSCLAIGRSCGTVEIWFKNGSNMQPSITVPGLRARGLRALVWQSGRLFGSSLDGSLLEVDFSAIAQHYDDAVGGGGIWGLDASAELVAGACEDGKVRLFTPRDSATGLELTRILSGGNLGRLLCVKFHPGDSDVIYTGGMDAHIRKWSVKQRRVVDQISIPLLSRSIAVWTLDCTGGALACGDSLGRVHVWPNGDSGSLVTFAEHRADVLSVKFSSDAKALYASGVDSRVAAFRHVQEKWVYAYSHRAHTHDVRSLALVDSGANEMLCSGGVDAQLVSYPCQSFEKARPRKTSPFPQHNCVKFADLGKGKLCFVLHRFKAELWFLEPNQRKHHFLAEFNFGEASELRCGDISMNGNQLAVADDENGLSIFRITIAKKDALVTGQLANAGVSIEKVPFDVEVEGRVLSLAFVGSSQVLMVGTSSSAQAVDLDNGAVVQTFASSAGAIVGLSSSADGQWVAAVCMSPSLDAAEAVEVFNMDALRSVGLLPGAFLEGHHGAFRFSDDSSELIVARTNGSLMGFSVEEGLKQLWVVQHPWGFAERPIGIALNSAEPNVITVWSWSALLAFDKTAGKAEPRSLRKFKPLVHADFLEQDVLFVLEAPFVQALRHLPDVLERERFGT